MMNPSLLFFVGIMTTIAVIGAEVEQQWLQWRGPTRDGQVPAAQWPNQLNAETVKSTWRVELDDGYSSPIVDGKHVYTVETRDREKEVVRAINRTTGEQVWEASWEGSMSVPFFARANGSWVRSTPALYDGRLYVGGIRDVMVCLNTDDGEVLWKVDFTERYKTPLPDFGFVCSPLVDETGLYVQAGGSLVKLDRTTGAEIWRSMNDGGGMNGSAFSSPTMATIAGKPQLLVQTRTTLAGVDAETGDVLWSRNVPAFRGMNIITPIVYGDAVFTSSYGGGTRLIDVKYEDEQWSTSERWQTALQGYMSGPVVRGDFVYWHLRNQRVACYDLRNGEQKWRSSKSFGKYVSMAMNGSRILALDQRGTLYLLDATPEGLEVVGERDVSKGESWAHVAICGGEVFVREQKAIAAYKWAMQPSDNSGQAGSR
jgi:outer membrane protein assembly factor BamB